VTTGDLDAIAEDLIRAEDGIPTFKGYRGFPGSICTSPNAMVVHGIPGAYRLSEGDVVSLDVGVTLGGFVADSATTVPVGEIDPEAQCLLDVCQAALARGIAAARPENHVGDISAAVQRTTEEAGFAVVKQLVGHGVGRSMHEEPQVPNYGEPGRGVVLEEGMVLAVEPMVTAGRHQVRMGDDGWAIYSQDGSLAAHFEFTIAITAAGPRILTPWHESVTRVAA
jgi:methionyl aminopeptidase